MARRRPAERTGRARPTAPPLPMLSALLLSALPPAPAAPGLPPVAVDDAYTTAVGENLSVDAPGVLGNDHDPESDPLTAVLVDSSGAAGTLLLLPDGSLEYEVAPGFVGVDTFTYVANDGTQDSAPATVAFTVEPGPVLGPGAFVDEQAFLDAVAAQGWTVQQESFEDPLWPRSPATASSVTSLGVTWTPNNRGSGLTTGPGPALFGSYGFFELPHGSYATGTGCDVPGNCTDGWIATSDGPPFVAAGIWIHCNAGTAGIELVLDGDTANPVEFGGYGLPAGSTGFYGVVDGTGFRTWEVHETEGTVGDASFVFGDLFSFALGPAAGVAPYGCGVNPAGSLVLTGGAPLVGSTFTLGVDNPLGTQSPGSLSFASFALAPAPGFPCGLPLPGVGMAGSGAAGELLLGLAPPNPVATLVGDPWTGPGAPAQVAVTVPAKPLLAGLALYAQGLLLDPAPGADPYVGLTTALELHLGL